MKIILSIQILLILGLGIYSYQLYFALPSQQRLKVEEAVYNSLRSASHALEDLVYAKHHHLVETTIIKPHYQEILDKVSFLKQYVLSVDSVVEEIIDQPEYTLDDLKLIEKEIENCNQKFWDILAELRAKALGGTVFSDSVRYESYWQRWKIDHDFVLDQNWSDSIAKLSTTGQKRALIHLENSLNQYLFGWVWLLDSHAGWLMIGGDYPWRRYLVYSSPIIKGKESKLSFYNASDHIDYGVEYSVWLDGEEVQPDKYRTFHAKRSKPKKGWHPYEFKIKISIPEIKNYKKVYKDTTFKNVVLHYTK
ncbi:MAG: hypothetical protein GY810_30930 [Aureispira sp.]|nr:hypothetical protein [Aureispira sp.]